MKARKNTNARRSMMSHRLSLEDLCNQGPNGCSSGCGEPSLRILARLVLACACGMCFTAHAAPVLITFEDLQGGAMVDQQYAGQGITFNQLKCYDYSSHGPNFAHSGSKAIEQCYQQDEFCTTPIEMRFTETQRRVKVWTGFSFPLRDEVTVVLTAFNAQGGQVAQARADLVPTGDSLPIRTPLEVVDPNQSIVRADVALFFGGEEYITKDLAVDDVEFERETLFSPCGDVNDVCILYSFEDFPSTVFGNPGEVVRFEGFAVLTMANNPQPEGAQGWGLGVAVEGGAITKATVAGITVSTLYDEDGDRSTPLVNPYILDLADAEFQRTELTSGASPFAGAVSGIVLRSTREMTLQPEGVFRVARLTVEARIPVGRLCSRLKLRFADGLFGASAQFPTGNVVTMQGASYVPTLRSRQVTLCQWGDSVHDTFEPRPPPLPENDYDLNSDLFRRQSGSLAPLSYQRIAGLPNWVQVNNSTPEPFGAEGGAGKLDFFEVDYPSGAYSAVALNPMPAGVLTLLATATPVTNNSSRDGLDWLAINVGATGGDGHPFSSGSGVTGLIRDNGGYQIFNNGSLLKEGSVPAAGSYDLAITLDTEGTEYFFSINGQPVAERVSVVTRGRLVQIGGWGSEAPPGQPFPMHTLDDLTINIQPAGAQRPGDCNQDGALDISDGICLLGHLFLGVPATMPCELGTILDPGNVALLDSNGDARVDLSDAIRVFGYLFGGSAPPILGAACVPMEGCPDNSAKCAAQ